MTVNQYINIYIYICFCLWGTTIESVPESKKLVSFKVITLKGYMSLLQSSSLRNMLPIIAATFEFWITHVNEFVAPMFS